MQVLQIAFCPTIKSERDQSIWGVPCEIRKSLMPLQTRVVSECDLIPPPALWQTVVFCTQTDTRMARQADSSIPPKTFVLLGYDNVDARQPSANVA